MIKMNNKTVSAVRKGSTVIQFEVFHEESGPRGYLTIENKTQTFKGESAEKLHATFRERNADKFDPDISSTMEEIRLQDRYWGFKNGHIEGETIGMFAGKYKLPLSEIRVRFKDSISDSIPAVASPKLRKLYGREFAIHNTITNKKPASGLFTVSVLTDKKDWYSIVIDQFSPVEAVTAAEQTITRYGRETFFEKLSTL